MVSSPARRHSSRRRWLSSDTSTRRAPAARATLVTLASDSISGVADAALTSMAQQSLADALKVSFGVLKLIMLIMLVFYLFSNIFSVWSRKRVCRSSMRPGITV